MLGGDTAKTIDDNSLTPVPDSERKSGIYLSWLPAGVATSLLQLTIAGDITALVGSRLAHEILTGLGIRRRAHDRGAGGVRASGAAVVGGAVSRRPVESARH